MGKRKPAMRDKLLGFRRDMMGYVSSQECQSLGLRPVELEDYTFYKDTGVIQCSHHSFSAMNNGIWTF